ncbi:MAG: hypothetical protein FWB78_07630 [Treponema sp.]|nr:hypothetical protein [Treponema sp.]
MGKGITVRKGDRKGDRLETVVDISEKTLGLASNLFECVFEMIQSTAQIIEDVSEIKKRKRR